MHLLLSKCALQIHSWPGITKTTRQSDIAATGLYVIQANTPDAKSKLKQNAMGNFSLV